MNLNFGFNQEDSEDFSNLQYYENSQFPTNPYQVVTENFQTSRSAEKQQRGNKWDVAEDIALMSAWCLASEDSIRGKSQKKTSLWTRIKEIYDATQAENPKKFGKRNEDQMKGRFKRLNENGNKWVAAYREAYRQKRSGMSLKDIENEAHKIYEASGCKFNDLVVFNEVMCKHPKWALEIDRDITRSRPEYVVEEEGGGGDSSKRSRTSEEGDYINVESPNTGTSTIQRPIGRDAAKKKGKEKVSNELVAELRAMRVARENELEFMKKRHEVDQQMKLMEMQHQVLNTLLQKNLLSPEEEIIKQNLMLKFFGN